MGWLKSFLVGGVTAKTYQNVYNKPIVTAPDGFVVRGLKQKGFGSSWVITYSNQSAMNSTATFTISGNERSVSVGRETFHIDWP
jgi:hypothetical protein